MNRIGIRYRYKGRFEYHTRFITHLWGDEDHIYCQDRTGEDGPVILDGIAYWTLLFNPKEDLIDGDKVSDREDRRS